MAQTDDGRFAWQRSKSRALLSQEGRVSSVSNGRMIRRLIAFYLFKLRIVAEQRRVYGAGMNRAHFGRYTVISFQLDVLSISSRRDSKSGLARVGTVSRYNANGVSLLSTNGPVNALFEDQGRKHAGSVAARCLDDCELASSYVLSFHLNRRV